MQAQAEMRGIANEIIIAPVYISDAIFVRAGDRSLRPVRPATGRVGVRGSGI